MKYLEIPFNDCAYKLGQQIRHEVNSFYDKHLPLLQLLSCTDVFESV